MGQLNAEKLAAAQIGFSTRFMQAFRNTPTRHELLATIIPSQNVSEEHKWINPVPMLSEWVGERKVQKLRLDGFTVKNKDYAAGIVIHKNDIADDRLGLYNAALDQFGARAARHYEKLLADVLIDAFDGNTFKAFDGKPLCADDHDIGDGSAQDNKLTATLDDTGAYAEAWEKLLSFKDPEGEPLDATPSHLIVGPKYREKGMELLQAERNASGATNVHRGTAELLVMPRLTGSAASYWFLVDLRSPVKALMLQIREAIMPDSALDTKERWSRGELYFGAQGRHAVACGAWWTIVGSNGTT